MRPSASIAAVACALLQSTSALNAALQRQMSLLADMGLNPDGSTMNHAALDESFVKAVKSAASAKAAGKTNAAQETILPEYVQLTLDHFGYQTSDSQTFMNRFWVAESGYKPGGPVFIYDSGEQDAEPGALFRLQNETSFFKQIVDMYGGIGIMWEHRFYGNSTPYNISLDTPAEDFKFLTAQQALADVDQFAKQFSRPNINATLTPDQTPWVFVGGSYPGMRAAFVRNIYPDTIYASYASSAPVQASIDQSFYFDPVWRGLNAYGYGNCTQDIKAAVNYMDNIMDNDQDAAAQLKIQFLGLGADNNTHATFADALSVPFYLWQSYGVEGGTGGLRMFCDWLSTDPASNQLAPAEGWAQSKGANFTVNRWASYPYFAEIVNENMGSSCSGKANVTGDCNLNLRFPDPASISWTWQYCTQWGYFQSANLGDMQLISKYNSLDHQKDICHRQFPDASTDLLPEWPDANGTNAALGGWTIRPSNVYWSGGEFDPWRTLSPLSTEPFAPQDVTPFQSPPPQCGQGQPQNSLFGFTMNNAEHCFDFRTTFPDGAISRKYFTDALTSWLQCYQPKSGGYGQKYMRSFTA